MLEEKIGLEVAIDKLPTHVVIIMDGNGRWAVQRGLPRIEGHKAGIGVLVDITRFSAEIGLKYLTVYAFSSENWKRPQREVSLLIELFGKYLDEYCQKLHDNNIRMRFIGDFSAFPDSLCQAITDTTARTADNTGLELTIAVNYGGRWDITNAFRELSKKITTHEIKIEDINEPLVGRFMCLSDLPEPDLFIRTGGEKRISNYLLWQLAYTELYFDDCLWPSFSVEKLKKAFAWHAGRERKFGSISKQMAQHA